MKTSIYYFSGTGNSLAVARSIANELGETDVIPIPKAMHGDPDLAAPRLGLVFPVYVWGLPRTVADFVKQLKPHNGQYVFAVTTCGGTPGGTLLQLQRLLRKNGSDLDAGFVVREANNTPFTALHTDRTSTARSAASRRCRRSARPISSGTAIEPGSLGRCLLLIDDQPDPPPAGCSTRLLDRPWEVRQLPTAAVRLVGVAERGPLRRQAEWDLKNLGRCDRGILAVAPWTRRWGRHLKFLTLPKPPRSGRHTRLSDSLFHSLAGVTCAGCSQAGMWADRSDTTSRESGPLLL